MNIDITNDEYKAIFFASGLVETMMIDNRDTVEGLYYKEIYDNLHNLMEKTIISRNANFNYREYENTTSKEDTSV